MGKMIGIDLGTTNSCIAVMEAGVPQVVPSRSGGRTTPSVVAFTAGGEHVVGGIAKRQTLTNPNTVFSVKRLIGRKFDSPEAEEVRKFLPFELVAAPNGDVHIQVEDRVHSPPEISAFVLQELKAAAEDYLGEPVEGAVITVPAFFDDPQRQATRHAGLIAGFRVVRLINEPTAAALTYGLTNTRKSGQFVAVYDLGGGSFDMTILEIAEGLFQVRATCGATYLGGEDFDKRIIDWLIGEFQRESAIDLGHDRIALQRLKDAAEKAKCELSTAQQTEIVLPHIWADASGPKHLHTFLTRRNYEELTDELLERTIERCTRCLADAQVPPEEIDEVLLVGGQTRAPKLTEVVHKVFGKEPNCAVNPDEGVAMGAAIQAGIIQGELKDLVLFDVTPHTLLIPGPDGTQLPLIERNSTIPTRKSRVFTTVADNQTRIEVDVQQWAQFLDCRSLAKIELTSISPAPKLVPQIEVGFEIDVNGIVSVEATDQATGCRQTMTIHASSGLSQGEVDRLAAETLAREPEEKWQRERNAVSRQMDGLVANLKLSMDAVERALSADEQRRILDAIEKAQKARAEGGMAEIKGGLADLEKAAGIIGQAMLRPRRPWPPTASPLPGSPDDESPLTPPPVSALTRLFGTMDAMPIGWHGEVAGRFEPTNFETIGGDGMKQRGRLILVASPAAQALLAHLQQADHRIEDAGLVEVDGPTRHVRAFLSLVSPSTGEALLYLQSRLTRP